MGLRQLSVELAGRTVAPSTSQDGLTINVPAYSDNTKAGLRLSDQGTPSAGPHIDAEIFGTANAVDLHWWPTSPVGTTGGAALSIHAYRDPGAGQAAFIIDNTDAGCSLKIKNTQGTNNPNGWGSGNYLELYGYVGASAHGTSDGTMTNGSAVLTSASGTFSAVDVGKPIRVPGAGNAGGNLDTTILSRQSATQVTLATNALTSVTTANYLYPVVGNVNQVAKITGNPPGFGSVSNNGSGNVGALRFVNLAPGNANLAASPWSFETSAGQCTALQVVQPAGSATALLINQVGTGAALQLQKNGTSVWTATPTGTDGVNIAVGTTTGLKIGTATSQKVGFFNATPVVQQTLAAAASDAGTTQTLANSLRSALIALGLGA